MIGLYWGFYMAWGKTKADAALRARVRQLYRELFALFEAGKLQPLVDARLPLAKFADALARVQGREVIGKIVLEPERCLPKARSASGESSVFQCPGARNW